MTSPLLRAEIAHMKAVIGCALTDTVLGAGTMRIMLEDCLR